MAPLFLFDTIVTAWPNQLQLSPNANIKNWSLQDLAIAIRIGYDPIKLEAILLSHNNFQPKHTNNYLILLCWLYFNQFNRFAFNSTLGQLRQQDPTILEIRILTLISWLWADDISALLNAPSQLWRNEQQSQLLQLCRIALLLKSADLSTAQYKLNTWNGPLPLEAYMLQAKLYSQLGNEQAAISLLLPLIDKAPNCLRLYRQLLNHLIDGRDGINVMPIARAAIERFGEHPELLYHVTTLNLYQRHPGLARRSILLQQAWSSVCITPLNIGNQVTTYEMNGNVDWLEYLHPNIHATSIKSDAQLHSNLSMQLASLQSPLYSKHLTKLISGLLEMPEYLTFRDAGSGIPQPKPLQGKPLRIAWITGDLAYHPVSRFLYGFFAASQHKRNQNHTIVSLMDHGNESSKDAFNQLSAINVLDVSVDQNEHRVARIREQNFDIAIDLSGWTGGNYVAGFLARLAPVQVNYLGYFASMGLPTMDYWLGDNAIFPPNHSEWATETLWRLPRPFLAWQPFEPLPEASIEVADPPSGPVRFGSFNHNRKLSDATLRLWSGVLNAVPGSRLTLKAAADADADTQRLLRRRMIRNGIDPERIDWLALTKGPREHMQQYARIDIALDPIPNGGCTTTCEALWMGVPTITMAGKHYVSRMSTAVLTGADLTNWIAADSASYIALAQQHASSIHTLRNERSQWRKRLQASPLGDAANLMYHLEQAFSAMHLEMLSRS
jgi:predicted O-linked N-acetylglucosamine transferase (SPINDLY family)